MHFISEKMLRDFWRRHTEAESPLRAWVRRTRKSQWLNFADVRKSFPHADLVGKCVVFNIGGNKYRLITVIHFEASRQKVYVRPGSATCTAYIEIAKSVHFRFESWTEDLFGLVFLRGDRVQMLPQEFGQLVGGDFLGRTELEFHHVLVGAVGHELALGAQRGHAAQRETVLGASQHQVERRGFLGMDRRPWLAGAVDEQVDHLLVVPQELAFGRRLGQQLAQLFQHFHFPRNLLAWRKAFPRQVPLAAQHFPGHHVFGLLLHPFGERPKALDGPLQELPEGRPVDLFIRMHGQLHLLPRAAKLFALHARLAAVDRQVVHFVERLQVELAYQVFALEGALGHAELELEQPFFAGDGVQEPAVGLARSTNLNDRAGVPVRGAELAQLLDAIDHRGQNFAFPTAGQPAAADTLLRVPLAAVPLPRHLGFFADLGDIEVFRPLFFTGGEVVGPALDVRPRGQHGRQHFAGVGTIKVAGAEPGLVRRRGRIDVLARQCPGVAAPGHRLAATALGSARRQRARLCPSHQLFRTLRMRHNILRRARRDNVPAALAGFRSQVDHPVGRLDHVEIMLDDHHRIAQVDEPIEHVQKLGQIVEVQSGRR
ncbi:MAG: hypothetical protein B7Z73_12610, partial [Planctomycetia bacterium 21-64-5]